MEPDLTLLLAWGGLTGLEAAGVVTLPWYVKGGVMAGFAYAAVQLLPKLLRLLPGKTRTRWRLVSDHFMEGYASGVREGRG